MIESYSVFQGDEFTHCCKCRTENDLTMNEDGETICTDCLFEQTCEEMFGKFGDEDEFDNY